jgi:ATP adenylyltransferase/5',5'''-P-1,P-4-tetraphosphate phosphorylase II
MTKTNIPCKTSQREKHQKPLSTPSNQYIKDVFNSDASNTFLKIISW